MVAIGYGTQKLYYVSSVYIGPWIGPISVEGKRACDWSICIVSNELTYVNILVPDMHALWLNLTEELHRPLTSQCYLILLISRQCSSQIRMHRFVGIYVAKRERENEKQQQTDSYQRETDRHSETDEENHRERERGLR